MDNEPSLSDAVRVPRAVGDNALLKSPLIDEILKVIEELLKRFTSNAHLSISFRDIFPCTLGKIPICDFLHGCHCANRDEFIN